MTYVDGFLLPLPKKNVPAYRRLARQAAKVWRAHGALDYRECIGNDLDVPGMRPFPATLRTKKNETVVFAWISYKSRAHRDRVNKAVMQDPRIAKMMKGKPPFDCKRMCYGGFDVLVSG
jgi:uncharacterized protein YbaA (DUF1428 family)